MNFIHEVQAVVHIKIQFRHATELFANFGTQRLSNAPTLGLDLLERFVMEETDKSAREKREAKKEPCDLKKKDTSSYLAVNMDR